MDTLPKLSIIIPTCNRADQLDRSLKSLMVTTAAVKDFEIIIIDNGSKDHTQTITQKYQKEFPHFLIEYFYEPVPGLLSGRHKGADLSKAGIISFLDDDVKVSPDWINTIIITMGKRKDVTFMTGPNLPLYDSYPPDWIEWFWVKYNKGKYCTWLSLSDLGNEICEINPNMVWGLNFTIRKKAFYELGGFHPDCIPVSLQQFQGDGETGLTMEGEKKNMIALYHPGLLLYHEVSASRMTFEYFEKRAYYQGVCNSYTELRQQLLYPDEITEIPAQKSISTIKYIKNILRPFVPNSILKKRSKIIQEPVEYTKLKARFKLKEKEGFNFHQNAVRENLLIKDWVKKKDYFDYRLP